MQFQQEARTPSHHSEIRTPRSVHSRSSNIRQEQSPFIAGKRNNEYVNPTYESKVFQQDQGFVPQNNNFGNNKPQPQTNNFNYNQPQPQNNYYQPQPQNYNQPQNYTPPKPHNYNPPQPQNNYNQPQPQNNYNPPQLQNNYNPPQTQNNNFSYNQPQSQQPLIQNPPKNSQQEQNNGFNQPQPRTPQKGGPKSIVSTSSHGSQAVDMVCVNCINKHLMMQKKDREKMEKEKDQLLRQISESNYKDAMQKEMQKQRMMKEQYKNDATVQLEQINNKKAKEESVKKSQRNDPNSLPINGGDYDRYQRIQELQKELRDDLLRQINNKESEKRNEKFNPPNYKTTLDIGEYRPRTADPKNYGEELRDQIVWKENQKQWEKENDKKLSEAQKDLDRRFNNDIQNRKNQMENQKKEEMKRAYQDYIQNKMRKDQEELQEKERFNEAQQKIKEDLERQQYQDYLKRKEMEKTIGDTVKNQIEYNNLKKKMEKAEASSPMMGGICAHKCKMVSCSECNKKFPKQQMCKRAESPLKSTPKKYYD